MISKNKIKNKMKILLLFLTLIPSLSFGETLYLCETIIGKGYEMNSSTSQHINYDWGQGPFILKKDGENISSFNSAFTDMGTFKINGYSGIDSFWVAGDEGIQLKYSDGNFIYSQASHTGVKIWFLMAKCEIAD